MAVNKPVNVAFYRDTGNALLFSIPAAAIMAGISTP